MKVLDPSLSSILWVLSDYLRLDTAWTWHVLGKFLRKFSSTSRMFTNLGNNQLNMILMKLCCRAISTDDFIQIYQDSSRLASSASTASSSKPSCWTRSPGSRTPRRSLLRNKRKLRRTVPTGWSAGLTRFASRARWTTIVEATETRTGTGTQRMERRNTILLQRFRRKRSLCKTNPQLKGTQRWERFYHALWWS